MHNRATLTSINSQNGNIAFKYLEFEGNSFFDHFQRNNYFSFIWITNGNGKLKADFADYDFEANSLFAFSPYQPYMFSANSGKRNCYLFPP